MSTWKYFHENAADAWMRRVKLHRRKKSQKGLALSTLKPNAGDPKLSADIFNAMNDVPDGGVTVDAVNGNVTAASGEGCCESLVEALQSGYAYMLRNDGELIQLDSKYTVHPYIIQSKNAPLFSQVRLLFQDPHPLLWLYKNTAKESTKKLISHFICMMSECKEKYNIEIGDGLLELIDDSECVMADDEYVSETLEFLDNQLNQEFCRVRTSHLFSPYESNNDIYFRISSINFNWFDLIWTVVYENRTWIKTVTVVTDFPSKGTERYYECNGSLLKNLPIDEFITLEGNPIIEQFMVSDTNVFEDGYFDGFYKKFNPAQINRTSEFMLNELYDNYFKNFNKENNDKFKKLDDNFDMSTRTLL